MDTKRENSSEFFHFTPQLSRGRPRSGFTHPSRAAMRESGQLCVSLLPPAGASDLLKGLDIGAPSVAVAGLTPTNKQHSKRSVCHIMR